MPKDAPRNRTLASKIAAGSRALDQTIIQMALIAMEPRK
jgi:hypothetical protein